jgi:hypothetical protein
MSIGDLALLPTQGDLLAYERRHGAERLIVALNLGDSPERLQLPDWAGDCQMLLSTLAAEPTPIDGGTLLLQGNEGMIIALN